MTNPMLTESARAIYETYEDRPDYAQGQMNGLLAEELARAVLQSLRDPTPEMIEAGLSAVAPAFEDKPSIEDPDYASIMQMRADLYDEAQACWQAMLDSILSQQQGER